MTTQAKFKPTIQEIHQYIGEPLKLEIGNCTPDGYTGDAVYLHMSGPKYYMSIDVNYQHRDDQVELRITIGSKYSLTAKKRSALAMKIRDLVKWTRVTVRDSKSRYVDFQVDFMLAARNENEMKALSEAVHKVIKEIA